MAIEPYLQPLTGVDLYNSAITEDGARLDVTMFGFWGGQAFLDVRVYSTQAPDRTVEAHSQQCTESTNKRRDINMNREFGK